MGDNPAAGAVAAAENCRVALVQGGCAVRKSVVQTVGYAVLMAAAGAMCPTQQLLWLAGVPGLCGWPALCQPGANLSLHEFEVAAAAAVVCARLTYYLTCMPWCGVTVGGGLSAGCRYKFGDCIPHELCETAHKQRSSGRPRAVSNPDRVLGHGLLVFL